MKGYYKTVSCCREESPDEPSVYALLEAMFQEQRATQKSLALLQKAVTDNGEKLDQVLKENSKPKPYVERGYRS
jgi:outer membrane protein assembly factor BamD (BamD/ComL family)